MRGHHHAPCRDCQIGPCVCGNHHVWPSDYRAEHVRRLRDKELPPFSRRPLRYFVRVLLAFNVAVAAFCVYLVVR